MRKVFKWTGLVLGSIVILILLLVGAMYYIGTSKLNQTYQVTTAMLTLPADSAALEHGEHLTHIHGCRDCHGGDLSGQILLDIPPFRAVASNLTSGKGGVGAKYSAEDFDRAIRHGLRPDGSPLIIMPSAAFHQLSDEDAAALIAHLQTIPAVDNELPPTQMNLPGKIMSAAMFDPAMEVRTDPARSGPSPPKGATAEYGAYLTSITCAYCHGDGLVGNETPPIQGSPPAPNLAAAGQWTFEQFETAMTTGMRPSGQPLDPDYMPYKMFSSMHDDEVRAIHSYLATLGLQAAN